MARGGRLFRSCQSIYCLCLHVCLNPMADTASSNYTRGPCRAQGWTQQIWIVKGQSSRSQWHDTFAVFAVYFHKLSNIPSNLVKKTLLGVWWLMRTRWMKVRSWGYADSQVFVCTISQEHLKTNPLWFFLCFVDMTFRLFYFLFASRDYRKDKLLLDIAFFLAFRTTFGSAVSPAHFIRSVWSISRTGWEADGQLPFQTGLVLTRV